MGDRIGLIKNRIAQSKQMYKEGLQDAREFMLEEYSLNVELASANWELVDLKITGEDKYRETIEHNIQRIMQAEDNRFRKQQSQLDESNRTYATGTSNGASCVSPEFICSRDFTEITFSLGCCSRSPSKQVVLCGGRIVSL
ncbi:hypothetical protein [Nostoc sp.]|uniref:hypothetical protein n=1 Tax=Nostoc sp. TaxID=1180 RepID=UPI002FFAB7D2